MTVKVDQEKCVGCGLCASLNPDVFELGDDGKARVIKPKASAKECKEAADSCPSEAIAL